MANDDGNYLRWVRRQPCLGCGREPAEEAHHCGSNGVGQRSPDANAVPLCRDCHQARHDLRGPFRGFEKRHIKAWERMAVEVTQARRAVALRERVGAAEAGGRLPAV